MDPLSQSLTILERLVECPTVPGEANAQINDYVADTLSACGAKLVRIPITSGRC